MKKNIIGALEFVKAVKSWRMLPVLNVDATPSSEQHLIKISALLKNGENQ